VLQLRQLQVVLLQGFGVLIHLRQKRGERLLSCVLKCAKFSSQKLRVVV
jgi:hypothetical protein